MPCPDPKPKYRPLNCDDDKKKFPYVEVWGPENSTKRFAIGTRASFAVDRFNKKLVDAVKPVVCVEAFKEGEDPVEFGPDAPLMSMCTWDLRVVQEAPFEPIGVGDKIPNGELTYLDDDGKLQAHCIYDLVREKRVVFFGVPGAFTPTCSLKHVPGFIERAEEILDRGVKEIICITVNDPFVVKEWEKTYCDNKHIKFLCDGSAIWTKKIGLELDLYDRGMGVRSRRYCLLVDDTIVKIANIEEGGGLEISTANRIMSDLDSSKGFPLWPPITILTIYSALVAGYNEAVEAHRAEWKVNILHLPTIPLTFTAAALIILLGFRTTACYGRFDEARKTWGGNLNRCRDLARQACTWMTSKEDEKTLQYFIQYLKAYPYCMKENIEAEGRLHDELVYILNSEDLDAVLESTHHPNHCIQVLSELLEKSHVSEIMKAFMSSNITTFHDNVGICERLFKTPIPLSYTHLTSQFLIVWHLILPIALWDSCGWLVVLATFLSAAALFCIDEVGIQIEEPFSILPLQAICDGIRNNIDHICSSHKKIANLQCLQDLTLVESLKR